MLYPTKGFAFTLVATCPAIALSVARGKNLSIIIRDSKPHPLNSIGSFVVPKFLAI